MPNKKIVKEIRKGRIGALCSLATGG